MEQKKAELEIIVDLLKQWAIRYGEPVVLMSVSETAGMADVSLQRPDHEVVSVFKRYETPGAATPRESDT